MFAEIARVVAGAIDKGGFSAAKERHPHQIDAGQRDNAAVVPNLPLAIKNG